MEEKQEVMPQDGVVDRGGSSLPSFALQRAEQVGENGEGHCDCKGLLQSKEVCHSPTPAEVRDSEGRPVSAVGGGEASPSSRFIRGLVRPGIGVFNAGEKGRPCPLRLKQ